MWQKKKNLKGKPKILTLIGTFSERLCSVPHLAGVCSRGRSHRAFSPVHVSHPAERPRAAPPRSPVWPWCPTVESEFWTLSLQRRKSTMRVSSENQHPLTWPQFLVDTIKDNFLPSSGFSNYLFLMPCFSVKWDLSIPTVCLHFSSFRALCVPLYGKCDIYAKKKRKKIQLDS